MPACTFANCPFMTCQAPGDSGMRMLFATYNGMLCWLLAVNDSLADGTDPRSGANIFAKSVNRTFAGLSTNTAMIHRNKLI